MTLTPNKGRLLRNIGSSAQWMAQANEAPTPKASQLILNFMREAKIAKKQHCCKINCLGTPGLFDTLIKPTPHPTFARQLINMSKKKLFYIGFFAALALIFYLVLTLIIPGFGKKKSPPISFVRPFSFTNQDNKKITEKDIAGKVYVAEYFFTTCRGICPIMNNNMRLVYEEFKKDTGFLILSHTCDPDVDSVAQMKHYADSMKVDTKRWIFLTGRKDSLYNAARVSYTIDDPVNNLKNLDDQFLHSQFWALVDKNGDVRKVYDGLKESEINDLIRTARRLLKEK
jgi:protein SCO1